MEEEADDAEVDEDEEAEGMSSVDEDDDDWDTVHASKPTVELRISEGAKLPLAKLPPAP